MGMSQAKKDIGFTVNTDDNPFVKQLEPHAKEALGQLQAAEKLTGVVTIFHRRALAPLFLQMWAHGQNPLEISLALRLDPNFVQTTLDETIASTFGYWSNATTEQNFVRYMAFQMGIVRKLDEMCQKFDEDPKGTQYNAIISAQKTKADIFERTYDRGVKMGVLQGGKVDDGSKAGGDLEALAKMLNAERGKIDLMLADIEHEQITISRRKVKAKVKGGAKAKKQADQDDDMAVRDDDEAIEADVQSVSVVPETTSQVPDLLSDEAGLALTSALKDPDV
jgi:hypothetical protein